MKKPIPILVCCWMMTLGLTSSAQVQWYQNQDGNNPPPYGTYATSVRSFNSTSFIACYQWQVNNDEYTWKISRTALNGTELRTFFVTGIMANAEIRVKSNNAIYVLKRNYPYGQSPEYTVFRLNGNLDIVAEKTLVFPGDFSINSLNAFEIDADGNVYLAGDGQYPAPTGTGFASFVIKTSPGLVTRWTRMDSVQTSYTRLHVDRQQKVTVIADDYSNYPQVKIIRINSAGTIALTTTLVPDPARFSLNSMLDKDNHLLLFGGKMVNDTIQGAYLCKVSRTTGNVVYRRTLFPAPATQLNDIKMDDNGRLFSLATLYLPGDIQTRISRISNRSGRFIWTRTVSFLADSCQFARLVMGSGDRFFAVGEKKCGSYFAKGYALRIKKNSALDGNMPAPDSVAWQRYHTLVDGLLDNDQQLIGIGNTNDFDTITYTSSYYRAFAARFDDNTGGHRAMEETLRSAKTEGPEEGVPASAPRIFPNPAKDQLTVFAPAAGSYDQLTVYNLLGRVVLTQPMNGASVRLNVTGFENGVYLLVLRSALNNEEKTLKFMVRK